MNWLRRYNWAPEAITWHKIWTVRLAIFWAVISGLWMAIPAAIEYLPPMWYAGLCVFMSLLILFARLTNQQGLNV
jgi:hypothetical protein